MLLPFLRLVNQWEIQRVYSLRRFSPDGKTILTGSYRNSVRVWNAATGQPFGRLMNLVDAATEPDDPRMIVESVEYGPDGTTFLARNLGGTARLWNASLASPSSIRQVLRLPHIAPTVKSSSPERARTGAILGYDYRPADPQRLWSTMAVSCRWLSFPMEKQSSQAAGIRRQTVGCRLWSAHRSADDASEWRQFRGFQQGR